MVRDSLLARFIPAASATALVGLVVVTRPLAAIPRALALACVVGAWGAAVLFRRNDVRTHATVVTSIAAVTAAGQVDAGIPYGIGCVVFLFGCLVAMRTARAAPVTGGRARARAPLRVMLVLGISATVVAGALMTGLPRLAERVERKLHDVGDARDDVDLHAVAHLSRFESLIDVLVVGDDVHELTLGRSLGWLDQALE
ncbi:MAG TPA: hypothetical protein VM925_30100, partial [Labilithrix sp.]|nr:hypothetical protein [Labilithrix sp.]